MPGRSVVLAADVVECDKSEMSLPVSPLVLTVTGDGAQHPNYHGGITVSNFPFCSET